MSRLIDADALKRDVKRWFASTANRERMKEALDSAPTIEAEPVRHGRWNHDGPRFKGGVDWYSCSVCRNFHAAEWMKYCCMCGARMDGGNENG